MNRIAILVALAALPAMAAPIQTTTGTTTGTTTSTTTVSTKTTPKAVTKKTTTPKATTSSTTTGTKTAATTQSTTAKPASSPNVVPDKDRGKVVKAACSQLFVQTMFDDSLPVEQRVKTVEALATGLEKAKKDGVDDGVLQSALNILSTVDAGVVKNLPSYVATVVQVCEEKNYYGDSALRSAVQRFIKALKAM